MLNSQSVLHFNGYYVNEIIFTLNKKCDQKSIPVKIDLKKTCVDDGEKSLVTISVSVFDSKFEEDAPFYLFVSLTGEFIISGETEIDKELLLDTNAVAILFPYLRSAITNITSTANISPLILPTVNVTKLL